MRFNQLQQWLAWLETLHPSRIDLGLARVRRVAEQLDVLCLSAKVITVAGTNGKGSTIAALNVLISGSAVLGSKPRIGQYTSPHLNRFNERIIVAGQECSDLQLCEAFEQVDQARLFLSSESGDEVSLTYFEFTTLAALFIFKQQSLDYILLEIGLGGRLDAANIIDADISVITTIDLDHQAWLGESRDLIAQEKAAIARTNRPVIVGDTNPPAALFASIEQIGAKPYWAGVQKNNSNALFKTVETGHGLVKQGEQVVWRGELATGKKIVSEPLVWPTLCANNWSCAIQAYVLLFNDLPDTQALIKALSTTNLAGRGSSIYYEGREFLLDVAHNPQAIGRLVEQLQATANADKAQPCRHIGVFALLDDKPLAEIIGNLTKVFDSWLLPTLQNCERATCPEQIKSLIDKTVQSKKLLVTNSDKQYSLTKITDSVAEAIKWAVHNTTANDRIVICGSFYIVGEALALLESQSNERLFTAATV